MSILDKSDFSSKQFNMESEDFIPNIEVGTLNEGQLDELHTIVGDQFFKDDFNTIKNNHRSFRGLPINYQEL